MGDVRVVFILTFLTIGSSILALAEVMGRRTVANLDRLKDQPGLPPGRWDYLGLTFFRVWPRLVGAFRGTLRGERRKELEKLLARAGNPYNLSAEEFWALKILGLGASLALLAGVRLVNLTPVPAGLWLVPLVALKAPDLWLRIRVERRQRLILAQLPVVIDLILVCISGGENFHQAIRKVAGKMTGPLPEEFQRVGEEVAAGRSMVQALRAMSQRVGLRAVRSLVTALVVGETLGTPMAEILKIQADTARRERQDLIERRISSLPLKLTICTLVFFFPPIFVITVLPNLLAFVRGSW